MNVIPVFVMRPLRPAQKFVHLGLGLAALLLLTASWESSGIGEENERAGAPVESTARIEARV